jgi:lysyl-tRNA synthetase class 2
MSPAQATETPIGVSVLKERALMLQLARKFFSDRGVLEVDCCALGKRAAIASKIDVIQAAASDQETGFLHTSPEYAMKRLLANGSGDLYYLGHVFRKGDIGHLHNPEFMMAEWYRIGLSFAEMIQETSDFLSLFLTNLPLRIVSYHEAFERYVGIDVVSADIEELRRTARLFSAADSEEWDRDTYVHFLLSHAIEPHLGQGEMTALIDYPPHEAALACVVEKQGRNVAERFEIYHEGIELANGYHELADASELRRRFAEENEIRRLQNKETYLLDETFLEAMEKNFPDCCGVSVGFDRALMLKLKAKSIREVLPFSWPSN